MGKVFNKFLNICICIVGMANLLFFWFNLIYLFVRSEWISVWPWWVALLCVIVSLTIHILLIRYCIKSDVPVSNKEISGYVDDCA
jgi:membrane protein implicated in regulation of membrane protease activity